MLRRADLITVGIAAVFHTGLALVLVSRAEKPAPPKPKPVTLNFERRPEPPPELAAPKPEAPPPRAAARAPSVRKVAMRSRPAPAAARAAAEPAAAPPPVFAVAMASTTEVAAAGGVAGSTTNGTGSARSGAPGGTGSGEGTGFHPASTREVGSMPEVDADACGRAAVYPRAAEQAGAEGDVRLRVALNEKGRVHDVRVLRGLGHGLDQAAVDAIKNRCRFSAAINRDGQPVAFVIQSYTFHFELPR